MKAIWEKVKAVIKERIPLHIYKMWIEPLEFKEGEGEVIALSCPNFFYKKRIEDHYLLMIESEFRRMTGKLYKISVAISEEKENPKKKKPDHPEPDVQLSLPDIHAPQSGGRLLRRDFTFDRFVVGSNNDFAYSAALSLASQKDLTQNSLLLLSSTGMGKSHLSQAIGHHILSNHPLDKVYYITAEDFMSEMIHSFQSNSFEFFKEKYRTGCDVLLLEDVHFLNGKERTQVELSLALDYLFNAEKKIIFTSCCRPGDIPKLSEQLRSRFSSGLISNIEPPDFKTRIRILEKKVKENGYNVPKDVKDYLASELSENVRQLESGLIGVTAKASLMGSSIDLSLAESVVKNIVLQQRAISAEAIKNVVCKHYNVSMDEMLSKSRKKSLLWPRQIAIYLVRKYTDQPLQVIGKSFNRYHATILHSVAAVEKGLKEDASVRKQVEYLSQKLESGKF